jgi:hypothetical protein
LASTATFTTPVLSQTSNYYVSCTISKCTSSRTLATATIKAVPNAPTLTALASSISLGQSATLTATNCNGTVTWDNNLGTGPTKTVSPKITTIYKATCKVNNCESTASSVAINVNIPPIVTGTTTICKGTSATLTVTGCSGTVTWSDGTTGGSKSVTPTVTATYTATCTVNGVKSPNSNAVTVTVNPLPNAPTLTASVGSISLGQSATLTATNCNGTVTWDNNLGTGSTKTVSPKITTTYKATCKINNCESTASSVAINVNIPPTVTGTTTICKGTSATLTATGCSGTVTWSDNQTGTTVNVKPTVTTTYTATCTVSGVKSPNSNAVTVTVNPLPNAPTLTASASSISLGQSATLTATNCNGTVTWDSNLGTGPTKTVSPKITTIYKATCKVNNCESTASSVAINVNIPPTVTGTTTICKGTSAALTATGCSGTVTWSDNQTGTTVNVKPTVTTTYTAICTVNGVKSSNSNAVTVTVNPLPNAPTLTASAGSISLGQSATLTATNCNGTVTWDNNLGTRPTKTVSPKITTIYKATCKVNNCESTASSVAINVNIPPTVTGTTTICKGTSATLTATGCSGTVTWSDGTTGGSKSVTPAVTTTYTATCTVSGVKSSNSNAVTVTVNPLPNAPTLTASASSISLGQSATLTATNCNGTVTWDNNLGTGPTKTVSPKITTTYKATCKVNNCESTASSVAINVNIPPTVTGTTTICKGTSATLTATGCSGTVTWSDNQTGTTVNVKPTVTTTYTATCTVSGVKSPNSNAVTVTVNPLPNAPTLTASAGSISLGQSATLTATNCNGTVTWDNNLGTGPTKTVSPKITTTYKATCKVNNCESTASSVAINVNIPPTVTGTTTICKGTSATLTATGCSGTVTWSDGTTGGSKSVTPTVTATYTATCTVNGVKSPNSNAVTVTVNPLPNAPTLTASVGSISLGQSATLTATNCNGTVTWDNNLGTGYTKTVSPKITTTYKATCKVNNCESTASSVAINVNIPPTVTGTTTICKGTSATLTATGCSGTVTWSDNQTGTTVNVTPTVTTTYTAICTVNGVKSSNSNAVTVTVNPLPNAPTLTASAGSISLGQSATLTATNCNGTVTWDNNLGTGPTKTVSPKITTTYKATCKINNCESTASSVAINVNIPPTVTGTTTICKGTSAALTATGCSGTVTWSDNQTGTTVNVKPTVTTTYTAICTVSGVKSSNSNAVTVTVNPLPNAPTLIASAGSISLGQSATLTATNCNGTVTWDNNLGTGYTKTVSPKITTTYKATCKVNNCESTASNVAINVNTAPTITGTTTICKGTSATLTATGCSGTVTWSDGTTGGSKSVTPAVTATYTATCTVSGVKSSNSNAVTVTVNPLPNAPTLTASTGSISLGQSATLTATNCNGTVTWDNNLGTGYTKTVSPKITTTYKATCKVNNCESTASNVAINVNTAPTITGTTTICKGTSATLTATGCSGTVTWSDGTTGGSKSVTPAVTATYTATCTVSGVKSPNSNAVTVTVNPLPNAPTLTASAGSISLGQSATLTATNCNGTVTWDNNLGTGYKDSISKDNNYL